MSAKRRQQTLDGHVARERPPSGARAAVLDTLPQTIRIPPQVRWVRLAEERGTERVLRWIERAADEGVLVEEATRR